MEIKFNSVEEVLEFARHIQPDSIGPGKKTPEELAQRLGTIAREGRNAKIAAIIVYRAATGQGLKESKDAVERFWPFPVDNSR